ncbi:E3 SUMO-protein ligase ZBED1 [Frankliniella fusca]|uniref:E3 SUMO-protein ligase ZBED1 n=1 Tax=Frankliniella fusca TaxID=407009 RepID=A0AAE1HZA8_9NEOP|nr:E3 SUMO-protein ligase ZBED1 [Frankliniella fusca]
MADPSTPGAVLRPSFKEFENFSAFLEENSSLILDSGVVKVVPPAEWTPIVKHFDPKIILSPPREMVIERKSTGQHFQIKFRKRNVCWTYSQFRTQLEKKYGTPEKFAPSIEDLYKEVSESDSCTAPERHKHLFFNLKELPQDVEVTKYKQAATFVSSAKKQQKRLKDLDLATLVWLEKFLRVFREQTTGLEGQEYPTLPLVAPAARILRDHCLADLLDTVVDQVAMRNRAYNLLNTKFIPTMKQMMATFLTPCFRTLDVLNEADRQKVTDHVRALLKGERDVEGDGGAGNPSTPEPVAEPQAASAPPTAKHRRVADLYKTFKAPIITKDDEIDQYIKFANSEIDVEDMYTFWRAEMDPVTGRFRNLAKLAHKIMGKPATSAGSERVFSKAGFVMQARRNRLAPRTVHNMLFLHCYLHN